MSWLRLDANFFQSPAGLAMGFHGRLAFLAALCACKSGGNRGTVTKRYFTPEYVAQFVGDPGGVTSRDAYKDAISKLVELGLLEDDGTLYTITGWKQRQPNATNAERQRRWRQRQSSKGTVTSRNATPKDRNGSRYAKQAQADGSSDTVTSLSSLESGTVTSRNANNTDNVRSPFLRTDSARAPDASRASATRAKKKQEDDGVRKYTGPEWLALLASRGEK